MTQLFLPDNIRPLVDTLRDADLRSPTELITVVNNHLAAARKAAEESAFIDLNRAEQVGAACLALLQTWPTLNEPAQHWVQAACGYFADADDDEDDFTSIVGFEDDAEVLNFIVTELGRTDLLIDLD